MKNWFAVSRCLTLLCLANIINAATVSIDDPNSDKVVYMKTGEAVLETVVASDLYKYTWSQEPDDGSFNFDDLTYPVLFITNAKELNVGVYTITVMAHGSNRSSDIRKITFNVTSNRKDSNESNQHTLVFAALQEPIYIDEWTDIGKSVLQVTATDDDVASPDNEITYSIASNEFAIDNTTGLVTLQTTLNFTVQPEYELVITATDESSPPKSASITATASVQTRPRWLSPDPKQEVSVAINETYLNQSVPIYTLSATDDDSSAVLNYTLLRQEPNITVMFVVKTDTVYTNNVTFDIDVDDPILSYNLTLRVQDEQFTAYTVLKVLVMGVNQHAPNFTEDKYRASVDRKYPLNAIFLQVKATDPDKKRESETFPQLVSSKVSYMLMNESEIFYLEPIYGVFTLKQRPDESEYNLVVIATDDGTPAKSSTVEVIIQITGKTCTCAQTGDPHTTKFDGKRFHFQGICKYNLATSNDQRCEASVEAKHEHRRGNTRVSWTRFVDIKLPNNEVIRLDKGLRVLINGQLTTTPYSTADYEVVYRNKYLRFRLKTCFFQVMFDGNHRVYVKILKDYGNAMTGFCGKCNDDPTDDFLLPNGVDAAAGQRRDVVWGSYWEVPDDSDTPAANCKVDDQQNICSDTNNQMAESLCDQLNSETGPFSSYCDEDGVQSMADQRKEDCVFDVCDALESGEDPLPIACDHHEAFNTYLENQGYGSTDYSSGGFCLPECGDNEEYYSEVPCPRTCSHGPNDKPTCTDPPESGCGCKANYVLSGTKCVLSSQCGCFEGGVYYPIGDSYVTSDCTARRTCVDQGNGVSDFTDEYLGPCLSSATCQLNVNTGERECQCNAGLVGDGRVECIPECGTGSGRRCHEKAVCVGSGASAQCRCKADHFGNGVDDCIKLCMCQVRGDPHYKQWDKGMVHFQGSCTYVLMHAGVGDCEWVVLGTNRRRSPRAKVSVLEKLTIIIMSTNTTIVIDQGRKIRIDGIPHNGPLQTPLYHISFKGGFVVVRNPCGMVVMFNGRTTARLYVPPDDGLTATGICGNCNGDKTDDLKMRNGNILPRTRANYNVFGNDWLEQQPNEPNTECRRDDVQEDCDEAIEALIASNDLCGKIIDPDGPFKDAIALMDAEDLQELYDDCVFDVCANYDNETDRDSSVCNAMTNMMTESNDLPIEPVNFRTPTFCPYPCGENMEYSPAVTTAQASCKNPFAGEVTIGPPAEGCVCFKGYLLDDGQDRCIPADECGCTTVNNYYPPGQSFWQEDCTVKRTCVRTDGASSWITESVSCGANEKCISSNGVGVCDCIPGFVRSEPTGPCEKIDHCSPSPCERGTCENLPSDYKCRCPPGYIGDHCEEDIDECDPNPCKHGGTCVNSPGGYHCNCRYGWSGNHCTERTTCTCIAYGDPHINTFDGVIIHFQGICTYNLVEVSNGDCSLKVHVKNVRRNPRRKVSVIQTVYIITETDLIVFGQGRKLMVGKIGENILSRNPPYYTSEYKIIRKGRYLVFENNCGWQVLFDGRSRVLISIKIEVGPDAKGLCGNCDGVKNDLTTSNDTDVSWMRPRHKMYSVIGNSHIVPSYEGEEFGCGEEDEDVTCIAEENDVIATDGLCGLIKNNSSGSPFEECLGIPGNEADEYYDNCKYDVCAYYDLDPMIQACNALEAFMHHCYEIGAGEIWWRTDDFCSANCAGNMQYRPFVTETPASCVDPDPVQDDNASPMEGCICPDDMLLSNGEDICVAPEQCGCYDELSQRYTPIGETMVTEDCKSMYKCIDGTAGPTLEHVPDHTPCNIREECKAVNGEPTCVCKDGYIRIGEVCKDKPSYIGLAFGIVGAVAVLIGAVGICSYVYMSKKAKHWDKKLLTEETSKTKTKDQ